MKNLLLFMSLASMITLLSCGNDDSETETVVNELIFDGASLVGQNGIFVDIGESEDHYEVSFAISDGDINYNSGSGTFQFSTSSLFFLSFGAASFNTNEFTTGTFQFRSVVDSAPEDNFFFSGTFIDIPNSETLPVTDGTITISGTSPNYTLQFDLTLSGGKTLTGAFVGTFELEQG